VSLVSGESLRVVSGMRSTGHLHLGHYRGVLKKWIELQHKYDCFYFVADWHALTTHYDESFHIEEHVWNMVTDWLAAGLNPGSCTLFIQSRVPEHAELHLLLSMITPLSWLERVPTYKDQQEKLKEKDLATYGFLGYPLLQAADILAYNGALVPVGEDQVVHLELAREIARRFNHVYGKDIGFEEKAQLAIMKLGKKNAQLYRDLLKKYQETGNKEALETGQTLVAAQNSLSIGDTERLRGFLEGSGKMILMEPQAVWSDEAKLPGLDGQKMSKSYNNSNGLREEPRTVTKKSKEKPIDPARIRRSDPGDPAKCPVGHLHDVYSSIEVKEWVDKGCRTAGIGCLECKEPLIKAIIEEQAPIIEAAQPYIENPRLVKEIIREGCDLAREVAGQTLAQVRDAMGLPSRDR